MEEFTFSESKSISAYLESIQKNENVMANLEGLEETLDALDRFTMLV